MSSCAICTAVIVGTPRREPLGRNDALVSVCSACATETPRAYSSARGYEVREGMSQNEMLRRMSSFAERHEVHAAATFATKPWARQTHYLGHIRGWVLFERPGQSKTPSSNPLVDIERWRVQRA